jgi:hypothetical protein
MISDIGIWLVILAPALGAIENREWLFQGYGISVLLNEKSLGNGQWWWLNNSKNVLNTAELKNGEDDKFHVMCILQT